MNKIHEIKDVHFNDDYLVLSIDGIERELRDDYTSWTVSWTTTVNGQPATPVPAPSTIILLGSGVLCLAGYRRKIFRKV